MRTACTQPLPSDVPGAKGGHLSTTTAISAMLEKLRTRTRNSVLLLPECIAGPGGQAAQWPTVSPPSPPNRVAAQPMARPTTAPSAANHHGEVSGLPKPKMLISTASMKS